LLLGSALRYSDLEFPVRHDMTRRYFIPDLPTSGGPVELPTPEAHHAIRVMRVQVGQSVTLFDGAGSEAPAVITQLGRNECHCDAEPPAIVNREPTRAIHLGIALPKPDRSRELIERLTEIGVKSVTPLIAERTQRPPSESLLEKLRRGVIEACKQCERNELLQILPTTSSADFFAAEGFLAAEGLLAAEGRAQRLIAHRSAESGPLEAAGESSEIIAAIGPEGGWTDGEYKLALDHQFEPIDLGPRIYRVETAATVIAAVLVS
jgi:16S rRNA (uracil1498-N3)-methyltransferase